MKTLFFGSSEFALPSLRVTAERTDLQAVVTQPDRPSGRGRHMRATPVKSAALSLGVTVLEPENLRDFAQSVAVDCYDLFVLASYGRILPARLLEIARLGALNVHPSLLPKYRGATPIQQALLDGEMQTGVSIMLMDAGMDTGEIVLQERTPIAAGENFGELHERLAEFGARALAHAIDLARSGYLPRRPQHGTPSTTRPLRKDDLEIDWRWPAPRIVNAVRAFSPAPAARAQINGVTVKILRAREGPAALSAGDAGSIAGTDGDAVRVRCSGGTVDVLSVVPPSRSAQSGAAFAHAVR